MDRIAKTVSVLLLLFTAPAVAQDATAVWNVLNALPATPANFTYGRASAKSIRLVEQAQKGELANFPLMAGRVWSNQSFNGAAAYADFDLNLYRCSDYEAAHSAGPGWVPGAPAKEYADLTARFGPANNNILLDIVNGNRLGTWDLCRRLRLSYWGTSARVIVGASVPWMEEAYKIIADADRNFVDVVTLTQPDLTEGYQPFMDVIARAVAENVLTKRVDENLDLKSGAVKLNVRMAFSEWVQRRSRGDAVRHLAPRWGTAFRRQLGVVYNRLYGRAIPNGAGTGGKLNRAVQLGILYAYDGATPLDADWNHSKIISNGAKALVGGSNMYNDYMWQNDGTGVVYDTDLVLEGTPAKFASQWVDTIWRDYGGRVRRQDVARVTWTNTGSVIIAMVNSPTHGPISDFLNFGENVSLASAETTPSDGSTVISVGQRGWDFAPSDQGIGPYTVAQINAYDDAIAALIRSADDAPGTWIGIIQQDLLNNTVRSLGEESAALRVGRGERPPVPNTHQRFALADRIAREIAKPHEQQHLRVYVIKSSDSTGGGDSTKDTGDYNLYPLFKCIHILYENVQQRLRARYPQNMGSPRPGGWSDEQIREEFCNIFRATKWMRGRGNIVTATDLTTDTVHVRNDNLFRGRTHSKLVFVKGANGSAVSVGSLNAYDALMMHDYGNIVFDNGAQGSLTDQIRQRFNQDWDNSVYPKEERTVWTAGTTWGRKICSWQE